MQEKLSAMMDGALEDDEILAVVDALASEPELQSDWRAYNRLGDALRAQPQPPVDVVEKVLAGLEPEGTPARKPISI